ncbi:MAG: hypothetical protein KGZ25_06380, partial [Planctomycetes bacterium]|nr:hypothetical protein [Planctomycetota bacterium]
RRRSRLWSAAIFRRCAVVFRHFAVDYLEGGMPMPMIFKMAGTSAQRIPHGGRRCAFFVVFRRDPQVCAPRSELQPPAEVQSARGD